MNVKRLIFASLVLVTLLFACNPPGAPSIGGGGDVEDPTPTPEIKYKLNLSAMLDGAPYNYNISTSLDGTSFAPNTEITLGVNDFMNNEFVEWEGDIGSNDSTANIINITMDSDKSIIAHFTFTGTVTPTPGPTEDEIAVLFRQEFKYPPGQFQGPPPIIDPSWTITQFLGNSFEVNSVNEFLILELSKIYIFEASYIPQGWEIASLECKSNMPGDYDLPTLGGSSESGYNIQFSKSHNYPEDLNLVVTFHNIANSIDFDVENGTITLSSGDIRVFDEPENITVTAVPDENYELTSWVKFDFGTQTATPLDASGVDTILVDRAYAINATFSLIE